MLEAARRIELHSEASKPALFALPASLYCGLAGTVVIVVDMLVVGMNEGSPRPHHMRQHHPSIHPSARPPNRPQDVDKALLVLRSAIATGADWQTLEAYIKVGR